MMIKELSVPFPLKECCVALRVSRRVITSGREENSRYELRPTRSCVGRNADTIRKYIAEQEMEDRRLDQLAMPEVTPE